MSVLNTVAGASGGVLGSVISGAFSFGQQKRQFKYQKQLDQMANEFTESMWNKTNAYNSPANQLALAQGAGINPNLAIGNMGDATASQVQSSGPGNAAQGAGIDVSGINNIGQSIAQGQLVDSQIDLQKAQAEMYRAQANNYNANTDRTRQLTPLELDRMGKEINRLVSQFRLDNAQRKLVLGQLDRLQKMTPEEIANLQQTRKNLMIEYEKIQEEIKEIKSRIRVNDSTVFKNFAEGRQAYADASLKDAQSATETLRAKYQNLLNYSQQLQNDLDEAFNLVNVTRGLETFSEGNSFSVGNSGSFSNPLGKGGLKLGASWSRGHFYDQNTLGAIYKATSFYLQERSDHVDHLEFFRDNKGEYHFGYRKQGSDIFTEGRINPSYPTSKVKDDSYSSFIKWQKQNPKGKKMSYLEWRALYKHGRL